MRIAGYLRCSTKKQDLASQRTAIEAWASRNDHVVEFFDDDHTSGRKVDRKGLDALLAAVERGEHDLVAVVELSRIGRSLGHVHAVVERFTVKGVRLVLVNSGAVIDATKLEGKALLGALALAAEVEWHLIQERNARGRDTIKARGVRVGRKPREVSRAALAALREKGMSLRQIARELGVSAATLSRRLKPDSLRPGPPEAPPALL